jgi:hypothetical protein
MIEISIPELNEDTKKVKDIVITILAEEHPLTLIQIAKKIKKKHNLLVSYQGVRKALDHLVSKKILDKTNKQYQLNKSWVLKSKRFFDNILTNFETGKQAFQFSPKKALKDYAVYSFSNLLDLDVFWGEVMLYWAEHNKTEKKVFIGLGHYAWWFLINLGRETKIFELFQKNKVKSKFICLKDVPLNHWAINLYKEAGVSTQIIEAKHVDENSGLNIMGDTIIQVSYDKKLLEKVQEFYNKTKSVHQASPKEITKLAHMQGDIKFTIFKNKILARSLEKQYM